MDVSQKLNEDVLLELFACLSQSTLLSATLVCKRWHEVAQQIIDSTITLALAEVYAERNLRLFRRIEADEALCSSIKRIVVRDWHHSKLQEIRGDWNRLEDDEIRKYWPWRDGGYFSRTYAGENGQWWESTQEQVDALVRCLGVLKLTSFTWAAIPSVPDILARVLRERQQDSPIQILKNKLSVDNALWAYSPFCNHRGLANFYLLSNLVSFELLVAPSDSGLLQELGVFLTSINKTLQSLKVTAFGRLWLGAKTSLAGGVEQSHTGDQWLFLVRSMDWLTKPLIYQREKLGLRNLELTNFCICEPAQPISLEDITETQRLDSVKLSCFGLLERCHRPSLSSLHTLSLSFGNDVWEDVDRCISRWAPERIRSFLFKCTNLRQLELVDSPDVLSEDLLEIIGPNLTVLDVHQTISLSFRQRTILNLSHPMASPEEYPDRLIERISKSCSRLKQLAVNLRQHWPEVSRLGWSTTCLAVVPLCLPFQFNAAIEKIATSFPELEILNIYRIVEPYQLENGETDYDGFSKSSMLPIWDRYHKHSARPLSEMTLHLQDLIKLWQYYQNHLLSRVPSRTYVVRRCMNEGLDGVSTIEATMAEFEQATRQTLERAPQKSEASFEIFCRQPQRLCNHGHTTQ